MAHTQATIVFRDPRDARAQTDTPEYKAGCIFLFHLHAWRGASFWYASEDNAHQIKQNKQINLSHAQVPKPPQRFIGTHTPTTLSPHSYTAFGSGPQQQVQRTRTGYRTPMAARAASPATTRARRRTRRFWAQTSMPDMHAYTCRERLDACMRYCTCSSGFCKHIGTLYRQRVMVRTDKRMGVRVTCVNCPLHRFSTMAGDSASAKAAHTRTVTAGMRDCTDDMHIGG